MPKLDIVASPGQHVCKEFLSNDYFINCDIKIYEEWCGAGPKMIIDNSYKMVRVSYCPLCGDRLGTKTTLDKQT